MNISTKSEQVKAAFWYTISNFFVSGISFLTTPIFTRLLSVDDFGAFSSFNAWRNILLIITTMSLSSSINRARFDYEGRLNEYISTIASISVIIPSIAYIIVLLNVNFFSRIIGVQSELIHILFLGLIFPHVFDIFLMKNRVQNKYRISVALTLINSLSTLACSVALVLLLNDKLFGRVVGQVLPVSIIGLALYIIIMFQGKTISLEMVKYSIVISLPYIPHLLAGNLLSQSDRIVITNLIGSRETAFYSIGCTCSMLITIFLNSVNAAWAPWLGEKINNNSYGLINKNSKYYTLCFFSIYVLILFISPEFVRIYGGVKYIDAVVVLPPLITSTVFQFVYTQYVNIEQFEKKVWRVAVFTCISAAVNIGLNYLFVPMFGYVAAAYTTLASYALLCFLNYCSVKQMKLSTIYNNKFFFGLLITSILLCFLSVMVCKMVVIRYALLFVYLSVICIWIIKNKDVIKSVLWGKGKKSD